MIQLSVVVRDARLDAIETVIGASPTLVILSGALMVDTATADPGAVLATLPLPATWMNAAASGSKTLLGLWTAAAALTGIADHFRIYDGAAVCHMQGLVTDGSFPGDLALSGINVNAGDAVTITAFTLVDGNP